MEQTGESSNSRAVAWTVGTAPNGFKTVTVPYTRFDFVGLMKPYNIMNADPMTIRPYLLRSTMPDCYKWVKVGGIVPEEALKYMHAFIKSAWYQASLHKTADMTEAAVRKAGFILGVCRCIMVANHRLSENDLVAAETVGPYINVGVDADGSPVYTVLVAADPNPAAEGGAGAGTAAPGAAFVDKRTRLTDDLILERDEIDIMRVMVRSAQCIIPLQGHNLIVEGHHYLSSADKMSFKAFLSVERQVWVGSAAAAYLEGDLENVRDLMWHKAGHPVNIVVKHKAATLQLEADNLKAAGLSSAAVRLPAVEPEIMAINTYTRLCEACKPTIEMHDGTVNMEVFLDIRKALAVFPITAEAVLDANNRPVVFTFGPYYAGGKKTDASNRAAVVKYALEVINASKEKMALLFGSYTKILENHQAASTGIVNNTLARAYSLKKLRDEYPGQFGIGYDCGGDYLAWRTRMRTEGK